MDRDVARQSTLQDWKQASAADKAVIAKEKAKMAHAKFKETCTGKTLKIANFVAVGLLAVGLIFRFVYMFTGELKGPDYSGFWFFISTFFYLALLSLLALSLHPDENNKASLMIRVYFRVLDFDFGRGLFIIYMSMQMCEVHSNGEVIYAIATCIIAIIDMYIGFPEFKQNLFAISDDQQVELEVAKRDADDEALGQYGNVGEADSSRDNSQRAAETNEVVLETDDASTEFSQKEKADAAEKWKSSGADDVVQLDDNDSPNDVGNDPNKA